MRKLAYIILLALILVTSACVEREIDIYPPIEAMQEIDVYSAPPLWVEISGGRLRAGKTMVLHILYNARQSLEDASLLVELPPEMRFVEQLPTWRGDIVQGERKLFRVRVYILALPLSDVVRVTLQDEDHHFMVAWPPETTP